MPPQITPMSDTPENLVLELLRALRGDMVGLRREVRDVRDRLSALELGVAGIRRDLATLAETDARIAASVDGLSDRVDRIERRLDILPT